MDRYNRCVSKTTILYRPIYENIGSRLMNFANMNII